MGGTDMADDIEQLRCYLGLPTIDLFDHSNGGAIAISDAERCGAYLRKLILTSSQLLGFDVGKTIERFLLLPTRVIGAACRKSSNRVRTTMLNFVGSLIRRRPLYLYDPQVHAATFIRDMGESSATNDRNPADGAGEPGHCPLSWISCDERESRAPT
jgi:pimeloyl-ACP methyl ester carboxylesterase